MHFKNQPWRKTTFSSHYALNHQNISENNLWSKRLSVMFGYKAATVKILISLKGDSVNVAL